MDPMPMAGDAMTHLTAGAAVVYFIQWAKTSNLPVLKFLDRDTVLLNRVVSVTLAGIVTMGISWTGDAATGWVIHVPPATALLYSAWEFAKQFATQQMIYDTVTKRPVVIPPPTTVTINPPLASLPPVTPGPRI